MKVIKRIIQVIFILLVIGVLFRGWIYRHVLTYKSVGMRTSYHAKNKRLVDRIEADALMQSDADIREIVRRGLSITSRQLEFTADKNEVDPNKLIKSGTAHCVGYASFFATTCNYLLDKHNLAQTWTAKRHVGKLYFLGINVHAYFHTPFFKDHDFVTIENKSTGEILAVDPTVNDYLFIDFVTCAP